MATFGEELRRERELREIELREVAEATKINLRYLQALERNDFEHLPGGVFNKGFVRAYCQFVGIDPEDMVNAYLLEEQAQARARGEPAAPEPGPTPAPPSASPAGRKLWLGIGGVVGLGLVLYLLMTMWPAATDQRAPVAAQPPGGVPRGAQALPPGESVAPEPSGAAPLPLEPTLADDEDEENDGQAPRGPDRTPPSAGDRERRAARREPAEATADVPTPDLLEPAPAPTVQARLVLDRPTGGRVDCDGLDFEILDGMVAGSVLDLSCQSYLVVAVDDAGALRVGLDGSPPQALGPSGKAVRRRFDVASGPEEPR